MLVCWLWSAEALWKGIKLESKRCKGVFLKHSGLYTSLFRKEQYRKEYSWKEQCQENVTTKMAAGRVKFLLVISVWSLALSYAFELGKHCNLHVRTIKVPFDGNSITPWIKGSTLYRNWLTMRRSGSGVEAE